MKKVCTLVLMLICTMYAPVGYATDKKAIAIVVKNPKAAHLCEKLLKKTKSSEKLKREALATRGLSHCQSEFFPDLEEMEKLLMKIEQSKLSNISHFSFLKRGIAIQGTVPSSDHKNVIYNILETTLYVTYIVASRSQKKLTEEQIKKAIIAHNKAKAPSPQRHHKGIFHSFLKKKK